MFRMLVGLVVAALLTVSAHAQQPASSRLDDILKRGTLRVGMTGDGVLCAVHPEKPFDFAEKAYWLQRDVALKAFVDQWLHIAIQEGSFRKIYAAWFD
ncbi:MAG: hypothetical protein H0V72_13545 [Bradyrhizobium sp.]|nr:hypothetical protein [Bradyrhizobium sp.]